MPARSEYLKRWKAANKGKVAEYEARRKESGRKKDSDRRQYLKNREEKLSYRKEYYQANKEKAVESSRAWYSANREIALAKQRARYEKVKDTPMQKYGEYRRSARARKIKFELSFEQFMCFWQEPCHFCDEPIKTVGLDRFENDKGYVFGNAVSCCSGCNYAKRKDTAQDYVERCVRVAMRHGA